MSNYFNIKTRLVWLTIHCLYRPLYRSRLTPARLANTSLSPTLLVLSLVGPTIALSSLYILYLGNLEPENGHCCNLSLGAKIISFGPERLGLVKSGVGLGPVWSQIVQKPIYLVYAPLFFQRNIIYSAKNAYVLYFTYFTLHVHTGSLTATCVRRLVRHNLQNSAARLVSYS